MLRLQDTAHSVSTHPLVPTRPIFPGPALLLLRPAKGSSVPFHPPFLPLSTPAERLIKHFHAVVERRGF